MVAWKRSNRHVPLSPRPRNHGRLGLQIITPGFGRENSRNATHFPVKDPGRSLLYNRRAHSPRLSPHTSCCNVLTDRAFVRPLLTSELISEDLYTTHCDRILSALHDHPPEAPPQPNAANAANAAKPLQTTSPSKSQRSMGNSMAYTDPDGPTEYSAILSAAELAGLGIQSQHSNGSATTQVFVPSSALPELVSRPLPGHSA